MAVSVQPTISQQKRIERDRRNALRQAGLCTRCGNAPAGKNRNGSQGERCRPCADQLAMSRNYERTPKVQPPPKVNCDWFEVGCESFLDSQQVRHFVSSIVYPAIVRHQRRNGQAPNLREIKDLIDRKHTHLMNGLLLDALGDLIGAGYLREVPSGAMTRYALTDTEPKKVAGVRNFRYTANHVPRRREDLR